MITVGSKLSKIRTLFAVSMITVQYSLPVPAPLAQYSQFQFSAVQTTTDASHIVISYSLPAELTGNNETTIQLQGDFTKDQPLVLQGDRASATCNGTQYGEIGQCQITYRNLGLDSAAVSNFLSHSISDSAELQARLQVANIFASEPVGVLTYLHSESR